VGPSNSVLGMGLDHQGKGQFFLGGGQFWGHLPAHCKVYEYIWCAVDILDLIGTAHVFAEQGRWNGTVSVLPSVRSSVCPSMGPPQQAQCCSFAAVGPAGRRYRSIAAAAASECGQCHVVSVRG